MVDFFAAVCYIIIAAFKKRLLFIRNFLKNSATEVFNMSRVCSVCGKGQTSGNNVSHSKRRTRRTFKANVQKISYIDAKGNAVTGYVCTRCMKTVERA